TTTPAHLPHHESLYKSDVLSHYVFFTAPPTTELYTLSLHDALPILKPGRSSARTTCDRTSGGSGAPQRSTARSASSASPAIRFRDRKSTRPELQSRENLVCRLLLEKKKKSQRTTATT